MANIDFKAYKNDYFIDSDGEDEDYIDMEILTSSFTNNVEFEFQLMPSCRSLVSRNEQLNSEISTAFPADELFYKGKLLPLHLPPRLQMVQTIRQQQYNFIEEEEEEETFTIFPFISNTPQTQSPSESCRVSCDLCDDDHLSQHQCPNSTSSTSKKLTWPAKLIKASAYYLKSLLFPHKSAFSCESVPKKSSSVKVKRPMDNIGVKSTEDEMVTSITAHRKSFSGVIQRHNSCSSSSFSGTSSGSSSSSSSFSLSSIGNPCNDLQWLKRCSSATLELETSIEGAIAHCKHSSSLTSRIAV